MSEISIESFNKKYGIEKKIWFSEIGEITVVNIKTSHCEASIAMQGAQLINWTPVGQKPVIWLSQDARLVNGKSIRGGIPVCWPWFGAHDSQTHFPAHGYARTVQWELFEVNENEKGTVELGFKLVPNQSVAGMWPFSCPLELRIRLDSFLEVTLITQNNDSQPVKISEALHTYFAVGDIRKTRVSGLDGCFYLDKVKEFARFQQAGDILFTSETDRVYLDTENTCVIHDEAWQRKIHIEKQGSQSTVVWNPWQNKSNAMGDMGAEGYLSMLCVESANAATNVVVIEPGTEHRLMVRYHVT